MSKVQGENELGLLPKPNHRQNSCHLDSLENLSKEKSDFGDPMEESALGGVLSMLVQEETVRVLDGLGTKKKPYLVATSELVPEKI